MLHVFYCFSAISRTRKRGRMSQRAHYATAAYFRPEASNMLHNGRGVTPSRFWPTPFGDSCREKRPPRGPERPRICGGSIRPTRSGSAPPAMRWQAITCGGSPRLPADEAPRRDMRQTYCAAKCMNLAENVQHAARPHRCYTSGGARTGPSHESSWPEGVSPSRLLVSGEPRRCYTYAAAVSGAPPRRVPSAQFAARPRLTCCPARSSRRPRLSSFSRRARLSFTLIVLCVARFGETGRGATRAGGRDGPRGARRRGGGSARDRG